MYNLVKCIKIIHALGPSSKGKIKLNQESNYLKFAKNGSATL